MNYDYSVIKCNRKSYSIRITEDNKIIVRAPEHASQKDIENLLQSKKNWIDKILLFNEKNSVDNADVRNMRVAYLNGSVLPVIFDKKNYIDGDGIHITTVSNFKTAYVNGAGDDFISRFHNVEKVCNLYAKSVNFRSYKSRWGCCDGEKNIVFNFKLMMLPQPVQYYVMIHELCHIVYLNHSGQFWALVKKFVPDYSKLRKQLKNYSFLVKMY